MMKREEGHAVLHRQARAGHDRRGRLQRDEPTSAMTGKAGLQAPVQPGKDWTVVLRRQPARMVDGQPQSGYTDAFELICCDCGDDPGVLTATSHPGFGRSAGPTRSRRASPPMTSTSGTTGGRRLAQAPERWVMPPARTGCATMCHGRHGGSRTRPGLDDGQMSFH